MNVSARILLLSCALGLPACGDGLTSPGADGQSMVVLGAYHACALDSDGETTCWGVNTNGQTGIGGVMNRELPQQSIAGVTFASLALGFVHSCGLTGDGTAYCWGNNGGGRLGNDQVGIAVEPMMVSGGLTFVDMSAGGSHTCAVSDQSTAYCWGANGDGQLGIRDLGPDCGGTCAATPIPVDFTFEVQSITAGDAHTCALTTDAIAYCWGRNFDGQLGNGTLTDSPLPVLVQGGHRFLQLAAGGTHTCGLQTDSTAYCWGRNGSGQLGVPTTTTCAITGILCSSVPLAVETMRTFRTLSSGGSHSCAIAGDGTPHCWGRNREGQLGNGDVFDVPLPQQVLGGLRLQSVSVGAAHTCGVSFDSEVYCWGDNMRDQIGTGVQAFRYTEPQFVLSLADFS